MKPVDALKALFLVMTVVLAGCSGGGGGGGTQAQPPATGTAPSATIANNPTGTQAGAVTIPYRLFASNSTSVQVRAEFSADGGPFKPASEAQGGDGTSGLTASPDGAPHVFVWDSAKDIGQRRAQVKFRISTVGSDSVAETALFEVDNPPAPTISAFTPTTADSGVNTVVSIQGGSLLKTTAVNAVSATGGVLALTSLSIASDTQVFATIPASTPGGTYTLQLDTPSGRAIASTPLSLFDAAPVVTAITPTIAPATTGVTLKINGTRFDTAFGVQLENEATLVKLDLTGFVKRSPGEVVAQVPGGLQSGFYNVYVLNRSRTGRSQPGVRYTATRAPIVTSISPATAPNTSAVAITVNGEHFAGVTSGVLQPRAGGTTGKLGSIVVDSSTQLRATVPAGLKPTVYDLVLINASGAGSSLNAGFTATEEDPQVDFLAPDRVVNTAVRRITINGQNLLGTTKVIVQSPALRRELVPAFVVSLTQVQVDIPAFLPPDEYDVSVVNSRRESATRAVLTVTEVAPVLTTLNPSSGLNDREIAVTATGRNLLGALEVTLTGPRPATTLVQSLTPLVSLTDNTTITFIVLRDLRPGDYAVKVRNTVGTSNDLTYTAREAIPTVTGLVPSTVFNDAQNTLTIQGTGFFGAFRVLLSGPESRNFTPATPASNTELTVTLPAGLKPGNYSVLVTNTAGTSSGGPQLRIAEPLAVVNSVAPATSTNTTSTFLTVTGNHFLGASEVLASGPETLTITPVTVATVTQLTATFPALRRPGAYQIRVKNTAGTSTSFATFTLTESAPVIRTLSPTSGLNTRTTVVTVTGSNLAGTLEAILSKQGSTFTRTIGPVDIVIDSASQVRVTVPVDLQPGLYDFKLRNTVGTSNALTYSVTELKPSLTSIVPPSGLGNVTQNVSVNGANLLGVFQFTLHPSPTNSVLAMRQTTRSFAVPQPARSDQFGVSLTAPIVPGRYRATAVNTAARSDFTTGPLYTVTENVPVLTSLSPTSIPFDQSTTVTVNGSGLLGSLSVKFDAGTTSREFPPSRVISDSRIEVRVVAPITAAPYTVTVTNTAGRSNGLSFLVTDTAFKDRQFASSLAVTPDNRTLFVANGSVPKVTFMTIGSSGQLTKGGEITVGSEPVCIAITPQGNRAYVTNRASGTVSVLDVPGRAVLASIPVGTEPYGCVLTPTGRFLFVANTISNNVSVIDTQSNTVVRTIALTDGFFPFALACTNDGDTDDGDEKVYVTQYFGQLPAGQRPNTTYGDLDNGRVGKVTVIDVASQTILRTITLGSLDTGFTADRSAFGGSSTSPTRAWPNLLAHVVVRGKLAYVVNGATSPEPPVLFNVNEQAFISVIDTATDTESVTRSRNINQSAKGETPQGVFFNTPWGMAVAPSTNVGYMLSAASDVALKVTFSADGTPVVTGPANAQSNKGLVRIPVGKNPRSIIFDTSGGFAFVHNYIGRSVTVIQRGNDSVVDTEQSVDLPTAGSLAASILHGEELFNTSRGTSDRMSDHGWGSCFSCHPFGWTDTAVWSFESGPRKTTPCNGTYAKTDPADMRILNWSGTYDEVPDFELNIRTVSSDPNLTAGSNSPQGLIVGAPISDIPPLLTRANGGRSADWTDLDNYFKLGIRSPISPLRGQDVSAGRQAFAAAGCTECHGGAKWTSSKRTYSPPALPAQVSGAGEVTEVLRQVDTFLPNERTSTNGTARGANGFNPPSLLGWWAFPPHFHNGQASTPEEVLDRVLNTIPHRNIGIPGVLDSAQAKTDIVRFLKSIDDATVPFQGGKEPSSSSSLALTPDQRTLLVANGSVATVTVMQLDTSAVSLSKLVEIPVGQEPTSVAVNPEGTKAFVTNRGSGTVSVLDVATRTKTADIQVGAEPCGCALTPTGRFLYVANAMSNSISVIDTERQLVLATIPLPSGPPADHFPFAVAITNDGDLVDSDEKVYVTQYFGQLPGGSRPNPDLGDSDTGRVGKVTVISVNTQSIVNTVLLAPKVTGFTSDRTLFGGSPTADTSAWPNLIAGIAIRGNRAYVTSGATSPEGPVRFNTNEQAFLSVIDTVTDVEVPAQTINMNLSARAEVPQGPFFNTPWGVAVAPGGVSGYVLSAASDVAVRVAFGADGSPTILGQGGPTSSGIRRIDVGKNPRSVIFNRTGTRAFVHNHIGRSVTLIDAGTDTVFETRQSADLPVPGTLAASVLRGEELFNTSRGRSSLDGTPDRMSDHGWGSCFSCHPFGWTDTAVWAFKSGPRKTVPMNSTYSKLDSTDQRMLNWSASLDEVADFELNIRRVSSDPTITVSATSPQGLIVGVPISDIEPFRPKANNGRSADWTDIDNYTKFGIRSPISPLRGQDVSAGRAAFAAAGCTSCHGGSKWTSSRRNFTPPPGPTVNISNDQVLEVLRNVDTFRSSERTETNDQALGAAGFNPPSLLGWWAFPPYFHNGSMNTADEVLDRIINTQAHRNAGIPGLLDNPTTKQNLIRFLLSIDDATPNF